MFEGCTGIEYVELPSEIIVGNAATKGFAYMFKGCTSLKRCNNILFTIDNYVRRVEFTEMFSDCTSLEEIPLFTVKGGSQSAALLVGDKAYYKMFKGCTSLVDAGDFTIYGPNAGVYCNNGSMFEGCTSLEHGPILNKVIMDYNSVYGSMANFFKDCSSLKDIVYSKNFWPNKESFGANTVHTRNWVSGVPATGDFFCPATLPKIRSNHHIPFGWNIHTIDSSPLCFETEVTNNYITCAMTGIVNNIALEYSMDGSNWSDYTFNESILLANIGDKVYFRNKSNSSQLHPFFIDGTNFIRFRTKYKYTSNVKCSGNICTVLRKNGATYNHERISLSLLLSDMSLNAIPDLPLDPDISFGYSFRNSVLTNISIRVTKTTDINRLNHAFRESLNLSEAAIYFDYEYGLKNSGLRNTFYGCSSLSLIKCYRLKQWVTADATGKWLQGVSATGTFICCKTLDTTVRDESHIPDGWTVKTWEQEMSDQYPSVATLITQYPALGDIVDTYPEVAPFLDQYPNLVHSLIKTNKRPYMETRGDKWTTDIYPHEQMTGKVRYYRTNFRDSFSYGSSIENLNN